MAMLLCFGRLGGGSQSLPLPANRSQKDQIQMSAEAPVRSSQLHQRFIPRSEHLYSSLLYPRLVSFLHSFCWKFMLKPPLCLCASAEQKHPRQSARRSGSVPAEDHPQTSAGALGNPVRTSEVRGLHVGLRWWRYAARGRDETSN